MARNLFTHLGESSKLLSDNSDKPPFLLDKYSKTVGPIDNLVAQTPWKPEYVIPLSSRPKLWQLSLQMGESAFDIEKNFRFHKGHGFGDKAAQATVEIKTKMSQTSVEIDSKSSQTLMVWSDQDENFDENQPGTSLNKRRSESKSTSTDVAKSESKFSQTKLNELASRDTQTSPRSSVSASTQSSSQSVNHQSTSTQGHQPMRQETYHLEFHHHVEDEEVAAILERQHQLANQLLQMEDTDQPVANQRAALRRSPRIMAQSSQRGWQNVNVSPARSRRFDPVNASPGRGRGGSRSPERGSPSGIPTWKGKLLPDGAKRSQQKDNTSRSPLLKSGQVAKRSQSTRGRGKSRESTGDQPGTSGSPQGRRRGHGCQSPGPTIAKQPRSNSPRERTSPYKLEKSDGRPLEVPGVTKEIAEQAQMQEYMLAARNSIEAAILEAIENTASLQAKEEIFELINQQQAGKRGQSSENVDQGHQKGHQGHSLAGTSSQEYDSEGKMWEIGSVKKTEPALKTTHSLESSSSRGSQYVSSEEESARSDNKTRYDTGFFLYSSHSEGSNSFSTASSASTVVGEGEQETEGQDQSEVSQGQSEVNRDSPKLFRTSDWVIVNEIGKQLMERVPEKKDQEGPSARAGKFPPFHTSGNGGIPFENEATNEMPGGSSKKEPMEIQDSNSSNDEEHIIKIGGKGISSKRELQQIQSSTESEYELAPECSFIDFYKPELQQHRTSDELVRLTDSSTVLTMEDLMWVISLNKLAVQMETQPRFETRNNITSGIHVVDICFEV